VQFRRPTHPLLTRQHLPGGDVKWWFRDSNGNDIVFSSDNRTTDDVARPDVPNSDIPASDTGLRDVDGPDGAFSAFLV
jgi:hypothetical protein